MTLPLDMQTDGTRTRPLIPRLVFYVALAIVILIFVNLHARTWQYVVALLVVFLVRKTTQWETL